MNCHRAHLAISRFLDGELDPTGQSRLNRHLERCPECSTYLDDLRQGLAVLRETPMEEPSASFEWNLRRKLQEAEAEHRLLAKQPTTVSFWPRFAVSAAAALLLSLGGASVWYASIERGAPVPGAGPGAPAGHFAGSDNGHPVIGPRLESHGRNQPESGFRTVGEMNGNSTARQRALTIQPSDETVPLPLVRQGPESDRPDSLSEAGDGRP